MVTPREQRRLAAGLAMIIAIAASSSSTLAATLFWSGNGSTQGGNGTWDTTTAHFGSASGGPFTTVWNNTTNAADTATLGGSTSSIALGTDITVAAINVNNNSTISGASSLTGGVSPLTVNVGGSVRTTGGSINAPISGTAGLTVTGTFGPLLLGGASTFSGTATIGNATGIAVVKLNDSAAIPSTANINLRGGVIGLTASSGNLSRAMGTAANQLQWNGNGGFAAYGGNRSVTLGGGNINWNSGTFAKGNTFIVGRSDADSTLTLTNGLNLSGGTRTVQVDNGSADVDAIFSGQLGFTGGVNGTLVKTGAGTLALTANNLLAGAITVNAGSVQLGNGGAAGNLSALSTLTVANNATFAVKRSDTMAQGTNFPAIDGAGGFTQAGSGTTTLALTNSYTGPTSVLAGALEVTGALAATDVTVSGGASLGGVGTIGGNVIFASNSSFDFNAVAPLTVSGNVTFADPSNFGIANILGLDSSVAEGTYTLIAGTVNTTGLSNLGSGNAYDLGSGKSAFFQQGSLQVVVVPEPSICIAAASGALTLVMALARRRDTETVCPRHEG